MAFREGLGWSFRESLEPSWDVRKEPTWKLVELMDGESGNPSEEIRVELQRRSASKATDLSKVHTRILLRWLAIARVDSGYYVYSSHETFGPVITSKELRVELAKRPHITNKVEGEAKRRAASQRNEKADSRRRPGRKTPPALLREERSQREERKLAREAQERRRLKRLDRKAKR